MKLKQLIVSGIALGALAFTSGVVQPAQAAVGMDTPAPTQSLKRPASVTTQHYINVDGILLEPIDKKPNVIYVDGQPLVALRQVSEALGYKVSWDAPTKTALIDMNIATLAVQPDSKQVVRKGKLQIINLDTSESLLPAARMVDGILYVSPNALNDVTINKDEIYIVPQQSQLATDSNTQKGKRNGIETFLPDQGDKVIPYEEKETKEKKPLITVKRTNTKTDTKDTENTEYVRSNGLNR
ncbi:MAG: copper amine oxidase N-terminal domain-containing protein [Veillonella parvula]|nr:copper amine oxidase N-terminal domain-containing protein [Veillonella parvula]